ncbi:MAG: DUF3330 domain-containing protein [Rhodocyclaceae bacterium]|nr:MAG: DUF3330 domain-containing protein [Rhodocyclaceae bacterium]
MTASNKPLELELVACEVCMKEVPISAAATSEASDYVAHFCGMECHEKWKSQREISAVKIGTADS